MMSTNGSTMDELMTQLSHLKERLGGLEGIEKENEDLCETIKHNEERMSIIFENAPDAIYICDIKGTFIDGNRASEELTGYQRDELIGKSMLSLNLLTKTEVPKAAKLLAMNAVGKGTGPDVFTLKKKDGEYVIAEIRTFPVKIDGNTFVLGIARDITERKKMERALEESEYLYHALFDNASDIIQSVDDMGKFIDVNKKWMEVLGYTKEEAFELFLPNILRPDMVPKCTGLFEKVISGEEVPRIQTVFVSKDGTEVPVEGSATVLKRDDKIIGTIGIFRPLNEPVISCAVER